MFVLPLLLAPLLAGPLDLEPAGGTLHYQLTYQPEATPPRWAVSIDVQGLDPAHQEVAFVLQDWGEWTQAGEGYLLSHGGTAGLVQQEDSRSIFLFDAPEDWDGSLRFEYELGLLEGGTEQQSAFGLLPHFAPGYAFGYSNNTLAQLQVDGQPSGLASTIQLVAPEPWKAVSGWNGVSGPADRVPFTPENSALIAFGLDVVQQSREVEGGSFEFYQFGGGQDLSAEVLRMQSTFLPAYEEAWSEPLGKTSRVFLIKHQLGGTRLDHGVVVGFGPDRPERFVHSPYIVHLLAHEFFHEWLGGKLLREDSSLVWFGEGFTEYLSLFYCAKTRMVSEGWFVERMVELAREAIHKSALGQVAFGDPTINWRDGDGPHETMAYKGGALLAFAMDTELRKLGEPGLMQFLKTLSSRAGERYNLEDIRELLAELDLEEFYERHILGLEVPDLEEAFAVAGVPMVPVDCQLTYFGIRAEVAGSGQTVAALDAEGPAARAGVRVGDLIVQHSGETRQGVHVKESLQTPYKFGLLSLDPDEVLCTLHIEREGQPLELTVAPELIDGGVLESFIYESGGMDGFFD